MSDAAAATQAGAHSPEARPRWTILAAVFVGGALGTLVRAALADWFPHEPGAWPWATLAVNVAGALVIGVILGLAPRLAAADGRLQPFLATGICGGLTTFATLQVELVRLVDDGDWGVAAAYTVVSVVAGYAAVLAGRALAGSAGDAGGDAGAPGVDRRGGAGSGADVGHGA